MLLEAFLILAGLKMFSDRQQTGGANGATPQLPSFFHYVVGLTVFFAYLLTFGRAVWTAFTRQGFLQGLLAIFLYPVYAVWNLTSLIQAK